MNACRTTFDGGVILKGSQRLAGRVSIEPEGEPGAGPMLVTVTPRDEYGEGQPASVYAGPMSKVAVLTMDATPEQAERDEPSEYPTTRIHGGAQLPLGLEFSDCDILFYPARGGGVYGRGTLFVEITDGATGRSWRAPASLVRNVSSDKGQPRGPAVVIGADDLYPGEGLDDGPKNIPAEWAAAFVENYGRLPGSLREMGVWLDALGAGEWPEPDMLGSDGPDVGDTLGGNTPDATRAPGGAGALAETLRTAGGFLFKLAQRLDGMPF